MAIPVDNSHCARCGKPFACGMLDGVEKCWCAKLPPVKPVAGEGCVCRECLELSTTDPASQHVAR